MTDKLTAEQLDAEANKIFEEVHAIYKDMRATIETRMDAFGELLEASEAPEHIQMAIAKRLVKRLEEAAA